MYKFSGEQLKEFIRHIEGVTLYLDAAMQTEPENDPPATPASACPDLDELEYIVRERERMMNRMCGKWTCGANRCGIEIERRGDHLTLNYLKRNGCPQDERYVLLAFDDGSFIYYSRAIRITSVSYDAETDTLMISPGLDYTRVVEAES